MPSGFNVIWSDDASHNLDEIIDYFQFRWSERELKHFFRKLDAQIELISQNPLLFPIVDIELNIRRSVLSPQTTIYYQFIADVVTIITLFDNRQNPDVLSDFLKL